MLTNTEINSALIALSGVVISAALSFVIGILSTQYNYKQLFAQTVSKNRMDWINVWRENISSFLACAEILRNNCSCTSDEILRIEKEMYQARGMVVSRLNLAEPDHKAMLVLMNQFSIKCCDKDFVNQREAILALARKILKPEWERLKDEARGKGYGRRKH